jgi:signal transduction histidine kinase
MEATRGPLSLLLDPSDEVRADDVSWWMRELLPGMHLADAPSGRPTPEERMAVATIAWQWRGPNDSDEDRMAVTTTRPSLEAPLATEPIPVPVLGHALRPGIVLLEARGGGAGAAASEPRADDRALALLGCRDGAELAARWPAIRQRLAAGGLRLEDPAGTAAAPGALGTGGPSGTPGTPGTFTAPATQHASAAPAASTPLGEASALAALAAITALEALTVTSDVELPPDLTGGRRVRVSPVFMDHAATTVTAANAPTAANAVATAGAAAHRSTAATAANAAATAAGDDSRPGAPAALLLQDAELATALESDLRAAAQMRSLTQIAPAVAHDLRAPINAMVLNLEVLKETLAPPPGSLPGNPAHPAAAPPHPASSPSGPHPGPAQRPGSAGRDPRDRQQRYLAVLREELARLHQSLELFLAHVSPRGERQETLDWRGPAQDLAALLRPPARKQQAQIELLLPDAAVPIVVQRYLLRQALLHFGLAILERVPRDGTLEIRLERLPARARLRIAASPRPGTSAASHTIAAPAAAPAAAVLPPAPRFSAAGTDAREQVAHAIVAAFGGTSWPADPDGDLAFEIEFPLAESN